jgi:hypothetical protein
MRHRVVTLGFFLALAFVVPRTATAGPYADDLSKCLVKSTTEADKSLLVKWMFAAASLHPAVSSIASLTYEQRDELNRSMAQLFDRLIAESCRNEAQDAIKYEGPIAFRIGFQALGQVAAVGLFSHPSVASFIAEFSKYMDKGTAAQMLRPPAAPR